MKRVQQNVSASLSRNLEASSNEHSRIQENANADFLARLKARAQRERERELAKIVADPPNDPKGSTAALNHSNHNHLSTNVDASSSSSTGEFKKINLNQPHKKANRQTDGHSAIDVSGRRVSSNHNHLSTNTDASSSSSTGDFKKINSNPAHKKTNRDEKYESSTSDDSGRLLSSRNRSTLPIKQPAKINQMDEQCLTNSHNQYRVLVHSRHKHAEPIARVAEANFTDCVYKEMQHMYISNAYRTQSVAWPHILRGNSMVLINNAASGKTMSFLPAICSLVKDECDERMVPDGVGPVAVILCVTSVKVVEVAKLCRKFLTGFGNDARVVTGFGEQNIKRIVPLLLNGCGLLVCTVPYLYRLLQLEIDQKQKLFDKNRIKHLVIDDIDQIVGRFSNELNFVRKSLCPRGRNGETDVQIVVTARLWRPKWLGFFKWVMNPLLCIGAFIEAAVYGRSELLLKLIASSQKIKQVHATLLERKYMENRTIVVCKHSEEVLELVRRLKELSITPSFCHENSTIAEISDAELWNLEAPPGQNTVFVCTDEKLVEVNIKSAQNIIHFSLPSDWTTFSFRFSAMSDYFENFVVNDKPTRAPPFSLVLLDENNNQQLPRLIDFKLEHNVTGISDEILQLAKKIRRDIEDKRRVEMVAFCPNVLLLGVCNTSACKYRHILTYSDCSKDDLPRNGHIKMEILDYHSPSHYSVRILEHISPDAKKWTPVSREYLAFGMNFQNHYVVADNHRAHIPVHIGDLCVLRPQYYSDSSYQRCQVIRIDPKSKNVTVRLIDVGISLEAIRSDDLLKLTEEFSVFPAQAVDVRIANLIPYDYDGVWDKDSIYNVKSWLQEHCKENVYIEGTILWSRCLNTIWVDTLRLMEKLYTKTDVFVLSIREQLLKKKFGIDDDQCLLSLQRMSANCGIYDELPVEPKTQNRGRRFPSSETQTSSKKNLRHSSGQSTPSEPKTTTAEAHSNERWIEMQPNLQSVFLSTFYTPWQFYLQILSPELYALYDSIDEFTLEESNHLQILGDMTIGTMCLGRVDGKYNRAMVIAIDCNPDRDIMVTVFFVDLGKSYVLPMADLLAIPEYLVEKEPFQAILCSMYGIQPPNNDSDWDPDLCDRMYDEILNPCANMCIRPVEGRSGPKSNLGIRSYDCILVDMDTDQTSTINDKLVSSELACYHSVDCHQLPVNRNHDANTEIVDSDDDSDTAENWDNDNYQSFQKPDAAPESQNSADGEIRDFDYNFTEEEIMEVYRSLLNLPSDPKELLGMNTSESSEADVTEISEKKCEIDSENDNEPVPITSVNQPEILEITDPEDVFYRNVQLPALQRPAAVPNVKWQQGNTVILLVIEAPDVRDYYLHVTTTSLEFSCIIGDVPKTLHMNLLGCIDTEYTSHEVRGLSVYVRLIKTLRGPQFMWPRLLVADDVHRWLKYNTDAISFDETPKNQYRSKNVSFSPDTDSDDSEQEGTEPRFDHDNADPFSTEFD